MAGKKARKLAWVLSGMERQRMLSVEEWDRLRAMAQGLESECAVHGIATLILAEAPAVEILDVDGGVATVPLTMDDVSLREQEEYLAWELKALQELREKLMAPAAVPVPIF